MRRNEISRKMLQFSIKWVSAPLAHIINSPLEIGQFPRQWKIACIKPIPRKKNPEQ